MTLTELLTRMAKAWHETGRPVTRLRLGTDQFAALLSDPDTERAIKFTGDGKLNHAAIEALLGCRIVVDDAHPDAVDMHTSPHDAWERQQWWHE